MPELAKYGVQTTFYFPLITRDAADFITDAAHEAGDSKIIKDGGAAANTANAFVNEGAGWYSLTLSAAEMQAARIAISVIDQDVKEFEDQGVLIQTHGHASASITTDLNALALEATSQTIAGYLDTEVAAIKAKTDNLPSDPADASDIAGAFGTVNATLGTIAGYLDTEVAAIKAKTDNLPADPADASDIAGAFTTVNTKLDSISGNVDTEIAAIKAKTDLIPAAPATEANVTAVKAKTDLIPAAPAAVGDIPTAAQNAAGLLDLANGVETGVTFRQALRGFVAALLGKASGAGEDGDITFRNIGDTKDVIVATVDEDGNRDAVDLDLS